MHKTNKMRKIKTMWFKNPYLTLNLISLGIEHMDIRILAGLHQLHHIAMQEIRSYSLMPPQQILKNNRKKAL